MFSMRALFSAAKPLYEKAVPFSPITTPASPKSIGIVRVEILTRRRLDVDISGARRLAITRPHRDRRGS
jgi:hypothetical protein